MECLILKELVRLQIHETISPFCVTKLIRQQQLNIEVNHLIVQTNIRYYP